MDWLKLRKNSILKRRLENDVLRVGSDGRLSEAPKSPVKPARWLTGTSDVVCVDFRLDHDPATRGHRAELLTDLNSAFLHLRFQSPVYQSFAALVHQNFRADTQTTCNEANRTGIITGVLSRGPFLALCSSLESLMKHLDSSLGFGRSDEQTRQNLLGDRRSELNVKCELA